jgi:hypothetical protein
MYIWLGIFIAAENFSSNERAKIPILIVITVNFSSTTNGRKKKESDILKCRAGEIYSV